MAYMALSSMGTAVLLIGKNWQGCRSDCCDPAYFSKANARFGLDTEAHNESSSGRIKCIYDITVMLRADENECEIEQL
jgi:hypothetical protein